MRRWERIATLLSLGGIVVLIVSLQRDPKLAWTTSLNQAQKSARLEAKGLLICFTGSDWCPACIKLEQSILGTQTFANYAKNALILLKIDFLYRHEQSEDDKAINEMLRKQFQVEAFPTLIYLDKEGKELCRWRGNVFNNPKDLILKIKSCQ
jgi:thioredoxin-related protein